MKVYGSPLSKCLFGWGFLLLAFVITYVSGYTIDASCNGFSTGNIIAAVDEARNMAAYGVYRMSPTGNSPAVNAGVMQALLGRAGPSVFQRI